MGSQKQRPVVGEPGGIKVMLSGRIYDHRNRWLCDGSGRSNPPVLLADAVAVLIAELHQKELQ